MMIVVHLVQMSDYTLRVTNKYYHALYKNTLKTISLSSLTLKSMKSMALISACYFGYVTFVRIVRMKKKTLLTYYQSKGENGVHTQSIQFVVGVWNFVTGAMYFLLNAQRIQSLMTQRGPCFHVCWDGSINCNDVKRPPDMLLFIFSSNL